MNKAPAHITSIQSTVANGLLVAGSFVSMLAVVGSLMRIPETGWGFDMGIHIAISLLLCVFALLRHRLPLSMRGGVVLFVVFIGGAGAVVTYGVGGAGVAALTYTGVFATALFNRRVGMAALGLALAASAVLAAFIITGRVEPIIPGSDAQVSLAQWAFVILGLFAVGFSAVVAIGAAVTTANRVIAELEIAREETRNSERLLRDAIESLPVGLAYFDASDELTQFNETYRRFLSELVYVEQGLKIASIYGGLPCPTGLPTEAWRADTDSRLITLRSGSEPYEATLKSGRILRFQERATSDGGFIQMVEDLTKQRKDQSQIERLQRLDAVGQLTGGIAHDFNNLLAVIQGYSELLLLNKNYNEDAVRAIFKSAENGAQLTHRLLAYSRRQPLMARSVDIEALLEDMQSILSGSLGETIKLHYIVPRNLWRVHADATQIEVAILNLAINARDAMPDGGTLTFELNNITLDQENSANISEARTGDFVRLSAKDSGCGMDEETQARAFEPFFTTKDVGEGSGLGLSMVYGFAQQSNGHVTIASELGRGTQVSIYLPRDASEA